MSALLQIEALDLVLDGPAGAMPILRGVSLSLAAGSVLGLVGESGAGKAVLGLTPPRARIAAGTLRFDGRDITRLAPEARRHLLGRDMALIPQDPMTALNPVMRIEAQMTDVIRFHLDLDRAAARRRALELLAAVHIRAPERVLQQYPHELSGGMRQRVLIAIAFACRPRLIVADEPTTALDVTVQRQILRLMKELQSTAGTALLFITHDLGVVAKICDRVAVMHGGRILEAADVAEVFARPRHDYTRALFAATPRYDHPADALVPVPAELMARLQAEAQAYDEARRHA
jgi:peptide/nickel transport system ATP-binding protein